MANSNIDPVFEILNCKIFDTWGTGFMQPTIQNLGDSMLLNNLEKSSYFIYSSYEQGGMSMVKTSIKHMYCYKLSSWNNKIVNTLYNTSCRKFILIVSLLALQLLVLSKIMNDGPSVSKCTDNLIFTIKLQRAIDI